MPNDSMQHSTSGHTKQVNNDGSDERSFQCSHCTLIFKSKAYLFEHLNKVHGFDVKAALRNAGLKYPEANKANTDNTGSSSGDSLKCQHCDFKAHSSDVLNEHEEQCQEKLDNPNVIGTVIISENPDTKITVISTDQHNEVAGAEESPPGLSATLTSKSKYMLDPSKDVKIYKRALQTGTTNFAAPSGSSGKPPVKLAHNTKGTLILQESPSSSCSNNSGVFKVTAKSMIDMSNNDSTRFLQEDHLFMADLRKPKPMERFKETGRINTGKRVNNESSESRPAKKARSDEDETNLPKKEDASKQQSSSSPTFSFDISEDEEEKKLKVVTGDTESPKVYFCKHCDYSDVSIRCVSTHYKNDHPYIRYNAAYLQDSNNQSATFRCLKCPVEFLSTADLKRHYVKNHPETPDVFKMQSCELSLVFKCFVCTFTTNVLKALKEHYKEKHPTHEVDNSLLYCRYSLAGCQEESPQLNTCEKMSSPETSGGISPKSAHTPAKTATSPQHPTSKGADVALYECNSCKFSHKSAVVLHVHYQKSHPDEAITIDKIKQSARVTSQMMPEKSPNSVTVKEKSTTLKNISEFLKKTKDKAELSTQRKISSFLINPKHVPEASTNHSGSPATEKVESVEDGSNKKRIFTKRKRETTTGMDGLSHSSPNEVFYCQFCSYTNTNIRSVVGHHNAKHTRHAVTNIEEVVWYSREMWKEKLQSEAKTSKSTPPAHSETGKQVEVCSDEDDGAAHASSTGFNAYALAENLFYCQKCNFGNPSVKGVLNHQAILHRRQNFTRAGIIEHTALVRDEIEKSKSRPKALSFCTYIPLPLMNEGDEDKIFCHFCNYRHGKMDQVVKHYSKRHRGFTFKAPHIQQYTSMVLQRTQKSPQKTTVNREVYQESLGKTENAKKLAKPFSVSPSPSATASQTQRTLQCYRCTYSNQLVYHLKRHIWKAHHVKRSVTAVLKACFRKGALQPGYHCEFCVFSHEKAAAVYKHYQEQHPGYKSSLEFVSTRLYVGPKPFSIGKKKPKLKHTDGIGDDDGEGDDSLTAQRSGQDETKKYSCCTCSFKGSSLSCIARHYHVVHSGSTKEDILDLNGKKATTNSPVEDNEEIPGLFDSYQVPLEFDKSFEDPTELTCSYCSASFNSHHGLKIHLGMKHNAGATETLEEQQEDEIQTRVHIFKCPHCTYINTIYQGVLAHCQMKHPALASRADSLHVDTTHLPNWDDYCKKKDSGDILRFSGYMCKTCPQICVTLDKLNKHCEEEHNETVAVPARTLSAVSKIQQSKAHGTQGSVSKASFLSKKMYTRIRCQQCSYVCKTKNALSQHSLVHHKSAVSKDFRHKCALCFTSYFSKKRLANHYLMKHGKGAYSELYAPVDKQVSENPQPTSPDHPKTQDPQNTSDSCQPGTTTTKNKIFIYKCPRCPYVNASHHGTLTHCQMKHPALTARADELQTDEIHITDLVRCTMGRSSNERGYMCKKCPQIHASLVKLKIHCLREHKHKVFEHLAETQTENQPVHSSEESEAASLKKKTSEVSLSETGHSSQQGFPETPQSNSLSVQNKELLYKCHMCTYAGWHRRYLHSHYKKTHKLDALSRFKLLEQYNKRQSNDGNLPESAESEESANYICKKCPNLAFDSSQLLIDHYSTFHRPDCELDFKVLSLGSKKHKSTGVYRCVHCKTQLNGIRKLCYHMDRHRARNKERFDAAKTKASLAATPEPTPIELCSKDEMPTLETVGELKKWNTAPTETFASPANPLPSPPKLTDVEQPVLESKESKCTCKQCGRKFMSLTGLRSHERSHAALAAIKKLDYFPTSVLKHDMNKYVIYKSGNTKPFLCCICSYKTTVLGLWCSHFMKKHEDVLVDPAETDENEGSADSEPPYSSEKTDNLPALEEEAGLTEAESLYSEPPDVQRQLNHYSLMTQSSTKSKANLQESNLPESRLLHCERCNFSSPQLSNIRRHYLNRHGAKILRCKDCNFFTGLRKTLTLHMETGHTGSQSEPPHQKDIRCPFCLYQTNNKNNMINHIILHREERVVPIEVRRPKLSRYLQGVVFRCHKCTFSSGSAENLRLHMMKHDDVRPYKCRLCYFDCTQLTDLEAHLSDKHQVVRNHKLVGQVSLDELEARRGRMPEDEEGPLFNLGQHNDDYSDDVETEEFVTDSDEVENLAENNTREKMPVQVKDARQKQEQDRDEESRAKSSIVDIQYENTKPNTAVQRTHKQDPEKHAGVGLLLDTAKGQELGNAGQNVGEGNNADIQSKGCSGPEKERQTNRNHAHPKLEDTEDSSKTLTQQEEEAAEGSFTTHFETAEETQDHKIQIKARKLNIQAKVEDDILRHILLLDEDGSLRKIYKNADKERTVKMEANIEAKGLDNGLSDIPLLDKERGVTLAQNTKNQVNTQALEKINCAQSSNTIERHFLTLSPTCPPQKLGHKSSLGFSFANCKQEQVHDQKICEEATESYREMPVLENEYLKEEKQLTRCCKEEEEEDDHPEEKLDKEAEMIIDNNEKRRKDEDSPRVYKGAFTATEAAPEALLSSLTEEKPYTCEFCGRNLTSSSELKRHIMRHGI